MASTAITAQGSTLQIDNDTPGTPDTAISNIVSYSGFDGEASEIDTTNLDSVAKEYLIGLQDFGSFSFEFHPDYTDAGQNVLRAAQTSGATKTFLLTLSDTTTIQFTALVKNAQAVSGGVDATHNGTANLKITGAITIDSTSA